MSTGVLQPAGERIKALLRGYTRAADIDVKAWNAGHPRHPKGPDGKWADVPDAGVAVVANKLKGAGRVDLEPGERLLKSDRMKGENGRAWLAVIEKDGKKSLRLGLGNANFGTRHDHGGPWRAGPDRTAEIDAERAELRADIEELEDELEAAEADPETDPRSLEERRAQLEDLYGAESGVGELPGGSTAMLDEGGARQLREALAKGLDDGKKLQAELDRPYAELDRLTLERDRLKLRARGRKFTDEEDAGWDRLTAEISRAQAELDPTSGPERPESGYWTFAEGSIPGQWADVHYDIYLDDPSVGVEVKLGAVPHGSDMDFDDMRGAEMTASFDIVEADELVRLLANLDTAPSRRATRSGHRRNGPDMDVSAWNAANPDNPRDGEGKFTDGPGGAVVSATADALDKLKLAKRAPAGFTVRSSKKIKTDYADVGVAEVDSPDGPQIRVGVIAGDRGKWDAGFTGEGRKTELRKQIAEKRAVFESDDDDVDVPGDIEDQIGELESELENLENERTAVLTPAAMADFRRRLGEGLEAAKANKAKVDADIKASEAIDEKRDALIAEFSDAELEKQISETSWRLREAQKTVKRLEHDLKHGHPRWSPELVAELLANWKAHVVEYDAELAPMLARRAQIMPPDARVRLEDLDRQYRELNDPDIDDILTSFEVSTSNGTRLRAEIWGSDDEDEQWVKTYLYVLAPGETTDDADSGDGYGWFRGLRGLNKLIAGLGESPQGANSTRSAAAIAASIVDTLVGHSYTRQQLRARKRWLELGAAPAPSRVRAAGVVDEHGNLHSPEDGKFISKGALKGRTGVLGSVLDKLDSLREKLGDDDRSVLDEALARLRGLESSDVDDDDLVEDEPDEEDEDDDEEDDDEVELAVGEPWPVETNQFHEASVTLGSDGEVIFDFDGDSFVMTPDVARNLLALLTLAVRTSPASRAQEYRDQDDNFELIIRSSGSEDVDVLRGRAGTPYEGVELEMQPAYSDYGDDFVEWQQALGDILRLAERESGRNKRQFVRHPAKPPHEQWMHAGQFIKKLFAGRKKAADKPPGLDQGPTFEPIPPLRKRGMPRSGQVRPELSSAQSAAVLNRLAAEEARRITGRDIAFDLEGADLQIGREYAEGVLRAIERYPSARLSAVRIGDPAEGVNRDRDDIDVDHIYARTLLNDDGGHELVFDRGWSSNPVAFREALAASAHRRTTGRGGVTSDPMGLAIHELAHVIDTSSGNLLSRIAQDMADRFLASRGEAPYRGNDYEERLASRARREMLVSGDVSSYATASWRELAAEAFADVEVNGDDAGELSRAIIDAFEDTNITGKERDSRGAWTRGSGSGVKAAGLAVLAADTGRVLMLQRALDEDDLAGGTWECPGGKLDPGETPLEAAKREWWDTSQLTGSNPALREELRHSVSKVLAAIAGATPGRGAPSVLVRAADLNVAGWNAANPRNPKGADGKWTEASSIVTPETPGELFRWFRQSRDPLGIIEVPGVHGLTGSARIGDDDSFGVNVYGDEGAVVIGNGTLSDGHRLTSTDELAVLGTDQIQKTRAMLRKAIHAAGSGGAFDAVVEGDDVGDLRISVDPGQRRVKVSAYSWSTASREEDAREELADLRSGYEDHLSGWDPVTDKEHFLGRWPTRDDFDSDAQAQEYLDEAGFDTWDDFEEFAELNDFEPYTFDEFLADLGREMPQQEFDPPPAADLAPSQAQDLLDAINRLTSDPPYYRLCQALRRGELGQILGQRGHIGFVRFDPDQPRVPDGPDAGQWMNVGLGGLLSKLYPDGETLVVGEFDDGNEGYVTVFSDGQLVVSVDQLQRPGEPKPERKVVSFLDADGAREVADRLDTYAEDADGFEDEDGEYEDISPDDSERTLIDHSLAADGQVVVGYNPENWVVVGWAKEDVAEPDPAHLDRDFDYWSIDPEDARRLRDVLTNAADRRGEAVEEEADTYSAGDQFDLIRYADGSFGFWDGADDSPLQLSASFAAMRQVFDELVRLRDAGGGEGRSSVGLFDFDVDADGNVKVTKRPYRQEITFKAGTLDAVIDALDDGLDAADYEGRRKYLPPELAYPTLAARMAVSIVDTLLGGRYTPQQHRARKAWLGRCGGQTERFWRPGAGVPFKKNKSGQWVDRYGKFADLPDLIKPMGGPKKAGAGQTEPAAVKTPSTAPARRPRKLRGDAPGAIARIEGLRQDPSPDAGEQAREVLAVLSGPQLKLVADHFGFKLHGRLIAEKRQRLEQDLFQDIKVGGKEAAAGEPLRPDGDEALAQVPAGRVRPDDRSGDVLRPAGSGDRRPDRRPRRPVGAAAAAGSAVPAADAADDGRTLDGGQGSAGGDAAEGRGRRDRRVVFRPRGQEDLAPATAKKRLAANLEALRTLRAIQADDRAATGPEQAKLARWSGWGSLPGVFKEPPPDNTYALGQKVLKQLLSPAEYAAARRTTRNAHYTDAGYVAAIWDAMRDLGFQGGQVLEPGSGSGTFMGMAPESIAGETHVTGVELDPITAAMARALYPNQTVRTESFADTKTADGVFDAAIGNVPFSDTKLVDREYNPGRKHNMHNHFILKSLRMTRPGGLVAVITSRYTMDSLNPSARREMAELGDLVGAVRLPSGAHSKAAGTEVVTDLLLFRRREPGAEYSGLPFEQTRTIDVDGKQIPVNEHFVDAGGDATDMVLGEFAAVHGMRGQDDLTVKGDKDAEPALRKALDRLAAQAKARGLTQTPGHSERPAFAAVGKAAKPDGYLQARPDGNFTRLVRGREQPHTVPAKQADELRQLLALRNTVMALVDVESSNVDDTAEMRRLRRELNDIYDSYVAKYGPVSRFTETRAKGSGADDVEEEKVTRTRPKQGGFRTDPFSAAVRALEIYDPVTNTARKADIFRKRGISPRTPAMAAQNPADALAITLDQVGEVDLDHVADLLGLDDGQRVREALGTLVFDEPGTGRLVPRAEYLSGNVRNKLEAARLAAAENPRFDTNVEALQRALPPDLTPAEIRAKMGAGWIHPRYVQQFLREILRDRTLTVKRKHGTDWEVKSDRKRSTAATSEWGIRERNAVELAEDILSQKPIRVDVDGKPSQEKTDAAQAKAKEIADRFEQWAWEDPARQKELQDAYNRKFNSLVLRSYDGGDMALPGLSREGFYAYPHRMAAIRRIIHEPSVGLWHEVGAGKTTSMIIGGQEMRRMGLIRKPGYVVPNHMLEQFTREFLERYPQARVLAIGADEVKNDKDGEKRRDVVARAATGDWDAVILTQGAFKRIPVSSETERSYLEAEAEPLRRSVQRRRDEVEREVRAANPGNGEAELAELVRDALGKDTTVKELEGLVERAEERVKEHQVATERDPGLTFEQTGIDYLFVDEAHTYKNLRTSSRIQGMGIPGSQIATDLHMKLHHLRSKHDRVATLATATPIANSVSEAYTMMRYVRPDLLEDMGIETFDEFAANFGEVVSRLEVAPTGGLRQHSRFAKFVNIPELLRAWLIASDVKTADDLKDIVKVPELAERVDSDGNTSRTPEIEVVPPSEDLKDFMASLVFRAKNIPYPPEKGGDNMLKITGEGRAAALDLQMVGRKTDEPTKLDIAADQIAGIYNDNADRVYTDKDGSPVGTPGALQLVFSDIGTPAQRKAKRTKGKAAQAAGGEPVLTEDQTGYFPEDVDLSDFNAYDALRDKLVARGIPRAKIRFIHEAKTDQEKAELFAAARDGRIAVLVGSTNKMGVGTNVQDRAVALHHLDAPWRPADVQQREGRIIRQGNKNPEVRVIRYVTEGSFDAYIWQAITTKGTFINQIMRGRADVREMDDVGDFALSAAEVTALGTGNRWLIEHAEARADLTRLERALRNHEADQRNLARQISAAEADVNLSEKTIKQAGDALATRVDTRGDNFRIGLVDTDYADRPDAQARLRQILRKVARGDDLDSTIGDFAGFPLRASPAGDGVELELLGAPGVVVAVGRAEIADGDIIGKLQARLGNLEKLRAHHVARLAEARQDVESLQARVGKPFRDADALSAARDRFERVERELRAELASRGQTLEPEDPVAKAAARKAAEIAGIRDRIDAGEGFAGVGELTSWLEADPELAKEIPNDSGAKWGVLTPRGQLLVMKDPRGGYMITIPRSMRTLKAISDMRTQRDAKKLAELLEASGIPWNTSTDLNLWRAPDGRSAAEVAARLRSEHKDLDKNGTWAQAADRMEAKRLMPQRLHEPLLEGQYRHDGLGMSNFLQIPRGHREEILAILRGSDPDSDLQTAARLREYVLDSTDHYTGHFAVGAAQRIEQDYRQRHPQPLDPIRKRLETKFDRIEYKWRERARIDRMLADADRSGDFAGAATELRKLIDDFDADRYGYGNQSVIDLAGDLAAALDELADRELVGARGVAASQARALLSAFTRHPSDAMREEIAGWVRAAGADTHPGGEELHHYWTKDPEGLAKWATLKEGRWTALYEHLKHHMPDWKAKKTASAWFLEVIGYAAGSDQNRVASGKPPRGEKIGPG